MARNKLEVALSLKDGLTAGLQKAGTRFDSFSNRLKQHRRTFLVIGAAIAGLAAISIKTADQTAAATGPLIEAIKRTGIAWQDVKDDTEDALRSIALSTGKLRTETAPLLARLVDATGDYAEAQRLLGFVLDLGTVKGVRLTTVLNALGAAYGGNVNTLNSLLEQVGISTKGFEGLAEAIAFYKGQAEATANQSAKFTAAINELQITLGQTLLPAFNAVLKGLVPVFGAFAQAPGPVKTIVVALGALVLVLVAIGLVIPPLIAGWTALNLAFLISPIGIIIAAVGALIVLIVLAVKNFDKLKRAIQGIPVVGRLFGGGRSDAVPATVPALAHGGIVRRPTLALVGESGPEAVVPLGRGGMGGAGMALTVQIIVPESSLVFLDNDSSLRRLAQAITPEISDVLRGRTAI